MAAQIPAKYIILVFSVLVTSGAFLTHELPLAMRQSLFGFFENQASSGDPEYILCLTYAIYSFPNIFMPLLTAKFMEKKGYQVPLILYSILILIGNIMIQRGLNMGSGGLFLAGFGVYGLGGGTLSFLLRDMLRRRFSKTNAFYMNGFIRGAARASIALAFWLPVILSIYAIEKLSFVVTIISAAIVVLTIIMVAIDNSKKPQAQQNSTENDSPTKKNRRSYAPDATTQEIMKDIINLKDIFWISFVIRTLYCVVFILGNVALAGYISQHYFPNSPPEEQQRQLAMLLGTIPIIDLVFTPIINKVTKKKGGRLSFLQLGSIMMIFGLILVRYMTPWISIVLIGLSYSMIIIPLKQVVALSVPERLQLQIVKAMNVAKHIAIVAASMLIAHLNVSSGEYLKSLTLIVILSVLNLCLIVYLTLLNRNNQVSLNSANKTAIKNQTEFSYIDKFIDDDMYDSLVNSDEKSKNDRQSVNEEQEHQFTFGDETVDSVPESEYRNVDSHRAR